MGSKRRADEKKLLKAITVPNAVFEIKESKKIGRYSQDIMG